MVTSDDGSYLAFGVEVRELGVTRVAMQDRDRPIPFPIARESSKRRARGTAISKTEFEFELRVSAPELACGPLATAHAGRADALNEGFLGEKEERDDGHHE